QGMGEMGDRITDSGLDFRVDMPRPLWAQADGPLLWRVLENLINNAVNYSLPGSRVYIDGSIEENCVKVEMKNISAAELNLTEAELMERFRRGDESRTAPGNGLGLAIARSLVTAQGGELTITIDGDLFKAAVAVPIIKK
ncbi:MAG: ATP-binding protein, partial [Clostridia bacterium]|nr:ATP-binding protein [Clostridia bacterium]